MEGRPCWCEVEDGEAMAVDVRRKPREEGVVAAVLKQYCSDSRDGAASNTGR